MSGLFFTVLNMSIKALWITLAVVLLRLVLKKAPKRLIAALWVPVGLRLIVPFSFKSAFSPVPSGEKMQERIGGVLSSASDTAINGSIAGGAVTVSDSSEGITAAAQAGINAGETAAVVWLIGAAAIIIYGVISYLRVKKLTAPSVMHENNVRICDEIATPFILGIFKPRIYLPSDLSAESAEFVLDHENAHIKRKDYLWKPLGFAVLAVHWFNPAVWLAYILLCRDIEFACDEKVIAQKGDDYKKAYSLALLDCAAERKTIAACPLAFGETGVKERIKTVMNYKKPAFWIIIAAVIAACIATVCLLTDKSASDLNSINLPGFDGKVLQNVERAEIANQKIGYLFESVSEGEEIRNLISQLKKIKISKEPYEQTDEGSEYLLTLFYENSDNLALYFCEDSIKISVDDSNGQINTYAYALEEREAVKPIIERADSLMLADRSKVAEEAEKLAAEERESINKRAGTLKPFTDEFYSAKYDVDGDGEEEIIVGVPAENGGVSILKIHGLSGEGYEDYMADRKLAPIVFDNGIIRVGGPHVENLYSYDYYGVENGEFRLLCTLSFAPAENGFTCTERRPGKYTREITADEFRSIGNELCGNAKEVELRWEKTDKSALVRYDLDSAVSQAILDMAKGRYADCEYLTESHVIFSAEYNKAKTETTVYLMQNISGFEFRNGIFMDVTGSVEPVVIKFKCSGGVYSDPEIIHMQDGAMLEKSVKKNFPAKYVKRALGTAPESENDSRILSTEILADANAYVASLGRTEKAGNYGDVDHILFTDIGMPVEVSNEFTMGVYGDYRYPDQIGSREVVIDGVRYVYKTEFEKSTNSLVCTKTKYDGGKLIERIVYDVQTGSLIAGHCYPEIKK